MSKTVLVVGSMAAAMLLFSPNPRAYPAILHEVRFEAGGVIVTNIKLTIFVVAVALVYCVPWVTLVEALR